MNRTTPIVRLALFVAAVSAAVSAQAQRIHNIWDLPHPNGIAAVVEEDIITYEDIRREMAPLMAGVLQQARTPAEKRQKLGELYLEILQNLVDRIVIIKDFREQGFEIPKNVLENEFDEVISRDFSGDRAKFHDNLRQQGKSPREFRTDLEERIIVSVQKQNMQKSKAEVSPEKIEAFYNKNKIHFYQEESVHLRLIMLKPFQDEPRENLMQTANKVIAQLDGRADFAKLAEEYSQDIRKSKGGDWGWIKRTDLRDELSTVAFSLAKGTHSRPIPVGEQIFILKVEDRVDEGIQPLEVVRDRIEEILINQLVQQNQRRWIERLRKKAYIRYY